MPYTYLTIFHVLLCSPLSTSEGLDKEVLFDLERTGLMDMEASSPSPVAASENCMPAYYMYMCTEFLKIFYMHSIRVLSNFRSIPIMNHYCGS